MEGTQTGFSGSSPTSTTTISNTNGSSGNEEDARSASPHTNVLLKEKAKDDLDRAESEAQQQQQQQLPSISEVESWRTTAAAAAYYHHPLVAVIDDPSALYDTYKLPSLAKFGKGLTTAFGKLPAAIWSVAVTSPDDAQGIPTATTVVSSGGSPTASSPSSIEQDRQAGNALTANAATAATIYLRGLEKERSVIIQQVMPDGSVQLRPLSDLQHEDDDGKALPVDELPPLAPAAAIEVKREPDQGSVNNNHDGGGGGSEESDPTTATVVSQEMPLQGAYLEGAFEEPNLGTGQYSVLTNVVVTSPPEYAAAAAQAATGLYTLTAATTDYYREYYTQPASEQYAQAVRQHLAAAAAAASANTFPQVAQVTSANGTATITGDADGYVERYVTAAGYRKGTAVVASAAANAQNAGIAVELPSPDSGIGGEAAAAVTPRDAATLHQIFEYAEPQTLLTEQDASIAPPSSASTSPSPGTVAAGSASGSRKTSWSGSGSEFGRTPEADKVHIPKVFSEVGFKYYLEAPISTSQRRDDDRMTYINKGQYYGLTLEYIPDPDRPLRSSTVKSLVMLVFREEKSPEDELKAWKFWHSRQHSVKQRILDVDTKNSSGVIGQIEEVTHNAIAFYWNPLDGPAKVSISVHCLSTDFSNQKGVKGLPLHLQIDTTDDLRENGGRVHRGYCQIKVFCDKGAERKTRDEERRAAKRKLTATPNSRKKLDEMYHVPCDRSEFYSMSDLTKPPVLFMPQDDPENCNGPELTFYAIATVPMDGDPVTGLQLQTIDSKMEINGQGRTNLLGLEGVPGMMENTGKDTLEDVKPTLEVPPPPVPVKKIKLAPPDRVLLYVKRVDEDVFHPLHLVPPTLNGLAKALVDKYGINSGMIRNLYKRCKKGITVEMDDDMIRHYCNEDTFLIDLIKTEDGQFDVTLVEL